MIVYNLKDLAKADFQNGISILVDKPLTWTSFDVVNKLRYMIRKILGVKKIKVGHAGTLDPLATGLLIIAIGKDTKKINDFQDLPKTYTGQMCLGASTPSYDSEFEPDQHYPTEHITQDKMEKCRLQFIGEIDQFPPAFSALKVDGKRAYKMARNGENPVMKSRKVEIYDFKLNTEHFPLLDFEVYCQKGTYIRSLAHDFGKAVESGAYLNKLRRTAIGNYRIDDAFKLDDLVEFLGSIIPGSTGKV
jgi:tRNA pseudouridine55 synthase